ncbi:MAG TPA: hypothetical protein PLW24_17825, partial [Burkholderiaceae bacterium]|nr:hypothetical protein [Burkholderiaceae bacterium]
VAGRGHVDGARLVVAAEGQDVTGVDSLIAGEISSVVSVRASVACKRPDYWLDVSAAVFVCSWEATAVSARCKASGSVFPRFSARRRMPAQAFALKK